MSKAKQALEELSVEVKIDEVRAQEKASEIRDLRRQVDAEYPQQEVCAQLAIARNAATTCSEKPTLIVPQPVSETAEFNHTTDAASVWLSYYRMPPRLRALVDAICGLSGKRADWFEASDVKIAKRMGRSTKTIQRDRDGLDVWQKRENVTFIEIEDHYTDRQGVRHPHKYRVHLPRLAVEAKQQAQASSKWAVDPAKATEQAVKEMRSRAPEMRQRKSHRRRQPGLEQIIESNIRRACNLLIKSIENLQSTELVKLMHGYQRSIKVKPELIALLEHCVAVLKGETTLDPELVAPLMAKMKVQPRSSGQNVHKETIHSQTVEDVVVGKDVPNDEETLRHVPSVGRVLRNNEGDYASR